MDFADQSIDAEVSIGKIPSSERKSSIFPPCVVGVDSRTFHRSFCMSLPHVLAIQIYILVLTERWGVLLMAQAASRDFIGIAILRVFSGAL